MPYRGSNFNQTNILIIVDKSCSSGSKSNVPNPAKLTRLARQEIRESDEILDTQALGTKLERRLRRK